jgi:hypothetical protein
VIFLDADDTLLPGAVAEIARLFRDRGVVKVHWPLWEIDDHGRRTGNVRPRGSLPAGDISGLLDDTPEYLMPPQSGTAWSRSFLKAVLPLPERGFESGGADTYLAIQAIAAIAELERLREAGARFLVFAWPAFWWLDHYSEFADYVRTRFERVAATDDLLVFDLGAAPR